jgi:4-hydroxybenzoate polyprenyltransferase
VVFIHFLRYLAVLGRVNMSPLTISVPILGAVASGNSPDVSTLAGLGLVGLYAHCFGFALNDLLDLTVDRQHPARQHHPLVSGALKIQAAWLFTLAQIPLALAIYLLWLKGNSAGLGMLCASIGLSAVYNVFGKKPVFVRAGRRPAPMSIVRPLLAEISLAGSVGLLCAVGALSVALSVTPLSLGFALILALILLLVNSVPSGLKDLKPDAAAGARNLALSTGTYVSADDRLMLTTMLRRYTLLLVVLISAGIITLTALYQPPLLAALLILMMTVYAALHLRMLLNLKTFTALRRSQPLLSGYYHYAALALVIFGKMPPLLQLLYALLALLLLAFPWLVAWKVWRGRHQPLADT